MFQNLPIRKWVSESKDGDILVKKLDGGLFHVTNRQAVVRETVAGLCRLTNS